MLRAAAGRLAPGGRVVVQTLHPLAVGPPYADGWREERYESMGGDFEPTAWFFRTFGSWVRALDAAGLRLSDVREPLTQAGASPLLADPGRGADLGQRHSISGRSGVADA